MGYFLSNIVVYGVLFFLLVMGYNALRDLNQKNNLSGWGSSRCKEVTTFVKKQRKMKTPKKPDGVAWSDEEQTYISKLLPYATSTSGPVIQVPNVDAFKKRSGQSLQTISSRTRRPPKQNQIICYPCRRYATRYSAKFKFEPIVGESYHLYVGDDGQNFLSLIAPSDWDKEHLGTFRLNVT